MIDKKIRRSTKERRLQFIAFVIIELLIAASAMIIWKGQEEQANIPKVIPARCKDTTVSYDFRKFDRSLFSIYEIAHIVTGAPIDVLKGLHYAESEFGANTNHKDPLDKGPFGLRAAFQKSRENRWGKLNPNDPLEAAIMAGYVYMADYKVLGDKDLAIAAYNQGVYGVKRDGPRLSYIKRVYKGSRA